MSIERNGDMINIACDVCGAEWDEYPSADFNIMWSAAKRLGWRAKKIANDWVHECPDCKEN